MVEKVYKFPLERVTQLMLPPGAEVLSVHHQQDIPVLWVKVDPEAPSIEGRNFITAMTGEALPEGVNLKFIGTTHLHNGTFVLHVFEVLKS